MQFLVLNYVLAFVEGFALIVSPCILPILPIILSAGVSGGRRRPWGIMFGFIVVFALFTFFSRVLVQSLGLDLDMVREVSFFLIIIFGVVLISDRLSFLFERLTGRIGNLGANLSAQNQQGGFLGGLLLGALVSLVWVPCGGPILAAAIVQTAVQKTALVSFFTFLFFALGSVIPMILIALLGRKFMASLPFLQAKSALLRKVFGIIMVLGALLAIFINPLANFVSMPEAPNVLMPATSTTPDHDQVLIHGLSPYPAPSLANEGVWLNSAPLTLEDLKGKVVLVDFWTYSCINCVRTLPYLKNWYARYAKEGLVIIGVHTPEFEFEKNVANVKEAVTKQGITYPVVLDNNYVIWSRYHNQYWPADYLIDQQGNVVYRHFGEGDYDEAEHNIQVLLGLKNQKLGNDLLVSPVPSGTFNQTPETYLGYARDDTFASMENMVQDQVAVYTYPPRLSYHHWAVEGAWLFGSQKITAMAPGAEIEINFSAAKVFVVGGSSTGAPVKMAVFLNDRPIEDTDAGGAVQQGILTLTGPGLYQVVNLSSPAMGVLKLKALTPGAELYTFTFGS